MAFGEAEVAEAYVRIRADTKHFTQEASGGISSGAKKLAAIFAAGFVVHKAFDFGKEVVADAALVQKYRETVQQEFGKSGEVIQKFSEGAAAQLGISSQDALQSASAYGILFKNLGIGQKKGADMTIQIEKLAGAMGQLKGQDPASALDALRLSLAGNTRGLKQFGIVADGATIKQQALKMGLIKTTKDAITPAIKAQAIYGIATKHLGEFQQQAAKHSGDLLNQQHVLTAEWTNAKEAIGNALLPAVTTLVGFLAKGMPTVIKLMEDAAKVIRDDLAQAFKFVGDQIDNFQPQIDSVIGFVKDNLGVIKQFGGAFLAIGAVMGAVALAAAATAAAFALLASPIIVIAAVAAGLYVLYQRSQAVHDAVQAFIGFVKSDVLPVLGQFASFVGDQISAALAYFQSLAPDAQKALGNLLTVVSGVIDAISGLWDRFGGTILAVLSAAWDAINVLVHAAVLQLKGVIDIALGLISGDWGRAWRGVKEIFRAAWDAISGLLRVALGLMKTLLGQAIGALGSAAKSLGLAIVHGVENGLAGIAHAVTSKLSAIPGALATAAANAFSGAVTIGENIFNGIKNGLGDLKGLIEQWVRDAISDLNPFSPVEHGGEVYIGAAITKGAVKGLGGLQGAIEDSLRGALTPPGGSGRGTGYGTPAPAQNGAGAVNLYGPVTINASSVGDMASELNKLARRVRR